MKRKDADGRIINPFDLFETKVKAALAAIKDLPSVGGNLSANVARCSALRLTDHLRSQSIDCVITSPPYHNAVDYYRRHQLEMYWLGLVESHDERLQMKDAYIGRAKIPIRDAPPSMVGGRLATYWNDAITRVSPARGRDFRHYVHAMSTTFKELKQVVRPGGLVVFVVGKSTWNGSKIPTADVLAEAAGDGFELTETMWYPVTNRYMSYSRHNGANIDKEYVMVLRHVAG